MSKNPIEFFGTTPLQRGKIRLAIDQAKFFLGKCEVIPNKDPFDINPNDYYFETDKLTDTDLRKKSNFCRGAVNEANLAVEYTKKGVRDYFRENIPIRFLHLRDDTLDDYKERCQLVLDGLKTAKKYIIRAGATPTPVWGYRVDLPREHGDYLVLEEKEVEPLKNLCKLLLSGELEKETIELEKYLKDEICPIANPNALSLHYTLNERKGDVDLDSGIDVRNIERYCIGFPMVKDLPYYDKKGKHILTIRVRVNENPDPHGRVGRITIIHTDKIVKMDDIVAETTTYIWNRLRTAWKREFFRSEVPPDLLYLDYDKEFFKHPLSIRKIINKKRRILLELLEKQGSYDSVMGSETCVWAAKAVSFEQQEVEAEDIERKLEQAETLIDKIEEYEDHIESYEELKHTGVIDAHPRQTLFDQTVSTMVGWIDYDLAAVDDFGTPIIDPMLANLLYQHIVKVDPSILSRNFIKLIEGEVERGTTTWLWAKAWLDRFSIVLRNLTPTDLQYIHNITKVPLSQLIEKVDIIKLLKKGVISTPLTRVKIADKYYELVEEPNIFYILGDKLKDKEFKKLWSRYFQAEIERMQDKLIMPEILGIEYIERIKWQMSLIDYELELLKKVKKTPEEQWITSFIKAREAGKIVGVGDEYKHPVGLFTKFKLTLEQHDISIIIKDHLNHHFFIFITSQPYEFFCDPERYLIEWEQKRFIEKMDWLTEHGIYTEEELKTIGDGEKIIGKVMSPYRYTLFHCKEWNWDDWKWDKNRILESILGFVEFEEAEWVKAPPSVGDLF